MSATMMDLLKKIQSDLADQQEYMRNLHAIHKNVNEKFNIMVRKMDQQQETIERLEQQTKKNNLLLFGNEETVVSIENKTVRDTLNVESYQDKETDEHMDYADPNLNNLGNDTEVADMTGTLNNGEHELTENSKDKSGDSIASELREIKDIIRDYVTTSKSSIDEAVGLVRKQEAVQISCNYFNSDQIHKLNGELKQIAEKYLSTNIFPVIEVKPGPSCTHPVMQQLHQGVRYKPYTGFEINLWTRGFKESEILDMLTENPSLKLYDVVKDGLLSRNEWNECSKIYNFSYPYIGQDWYSKMWRNSQNSKPFIVTQ